jgi:catechol 2,3-dioxygenase-like lactoylglutathione lyase family enzyme
MSKGHHFTSLVLVVRDIDASAKFYQGLFDMDVVIRQADALMLEDSDGFHMFLRAMPRWTRASPRIGIHLCSWSFDSREEIVRAGSWLAERDALISKTEVDGIMMFEGRDPDNIPLMLFYPVGHKHPPTLLDRIYAY